MPLNESSTIPEMCNSAFFGFDVVTGPRTRRRPMTRKGREGERDTGR